MEITVQTVKDFSWKLLKRCMPWLSRNCDFVLTIGMTLVVFYLMFGFDILMWNNTNFVNRGGDFSVSYMGSVFYRLDEWRWPVFTHMNLAYPFGISVHGTDGSPLLAFIFKILHKVFGVSPQAQFVGIWMLVSYVMQAYVSVLIFRHAFKNKWLITIGALFFVSSPIMLHRVFVHINLMPHFILLFAILMWMNNRLGRKEWIYMAVLFSLAFLTCPYFLPMQAVFFGMLIYRQWIEEKKLRFLSVVKGILFLAAVSLFWFYMLGMLSTGQQLSSGGWRLYGMNLATFICPTWGVPRIFRCQIPQDQFGNFDYDNYFGFGVFILFVLFFFHVKDLFRRENLRQHWLLSLALAGLFLFALSPQIRYMNATLVEYDPGQWINWIGDIFRYSGRFFWPIWYLLVFFLLKTAGKSFGKNAWFILPLFLFIQVWDLYPLFIDKVNFFKTSNSSEGLVTLQSPRWEELAQKYDNVFVFDFIGYEMAWKWAMQYNKNVNYGFLNRPTPKAKEMVDAVRQQILSGYISPQYKDYFFVLNPKVMTQIEELARLNPDMQKIKYAIEQIDGVYILEYNPDFAEITQSFAQATIPVAHQYWSDHLSQVSPYRIYRLMPDGKKDYATILEFNNDVLNLQWDEWGKELFRRQNDGWYHLVPATQ